MAGGFPQLEHQIRAYRDHRGARAGRGLVSEGLGVFVKLDDRFHETTQLHLGLSTVGHGVPVVPQCSRPCSQAAPARVAESSMMLAAISVLRSRRAS